MARKTRSQVLATYRVRELLSTDERIRLDGYARLKEQQAEANRRKIERVAQRRPVD